MASSLLSKVDERGSIARRNSTILFRFPETASSSDESFIAIVQDLHLSLVRIPNFRNLFEMRPDQQGGKTMSHRETWGNAYEKCIEIRVEGGIHIYDWSKAWSRRLH
jgi:hypothetical protein